jgi:Flp pilus assembly protein TadG
MRKHLRGEKGATMVEAAIVTPLLLLLTFSVVDFASMFYVYLALENGVAQATRYAVTGNQLDDPDKPGSKLSRVDSIKATMRSATPTLTIADSAFSFSHLAVGGSTWLAGTGGPSEVEKVTINYTWTVMTPVLRPFFPGGKVQLTVDSSMKNEPKFN